MNKSIPSALALALLAQPAGAANSAAPAEKIAQVGVANFWNTAQSCFQRLNSGKSKVLTTQKQSQGIVVSETADWGGNACARKHSRIDNATAQANTTCFIAMKNSDFVVVINLDSWWYADKDTAWKDWAFIAIQPKQPDQLPSIISYFTAVEPPELDIPSLSNDFDSLPSLRRTELEMVVRMTYQLVSACRARPS